MRTKADWLHGLMSWIPVVSRPLSAISIHCGCCKTIDKLEVPSIMLKQERHVEVRLKSIMDLVSEGQ